MTTISSNPALNQEMITDLNQILLAIDPIKNNPSIYLNQWVPAFFEAFITAENYAQRDREQKKEAFAVYETLRNLFQRIEEFADRSLGAEVHIKEIEAI